jgi:hypothetical protein
MMAHICIVHKRFFENLTMVETMHGIAAFVCCYLGKNERIPFLSFLPGALATSIIDYPVPRRSF